MLQNLSPAQRKVITEHAKKIHTYRISIRQYVKDTWGLVPQPVKPEYQEQWDEVCRATWKNWEDKKKTVKAEWFGDPVPNTSPQQWTWYHPEGNITSREEFISKKYYSWQQTLILIEVEKAVAGDAPRKLSTVSGHGIGKSSSCSWIVLWFLYCYMESQVAVTAPTSSQMHDVLWKELSIWINKMPEEMKELYFWSKDYVRMNYAPDSWFARARTSTKENTEAIAGVHSTSGVAIVADESSGIPEQVFVAAQGALTSGKVLFIMISNGTRTIGYFYDSHHRSKADWQLLSFNSEDSPLVDETYCSDMAKQYGIGSQEYKIRVKGGFPDEESMDDSGYLQLIPRNKIIVRIKDGETVFVGRKILGIDPSGEGKDLATFVLRDRFKMECVKKMQTTNDREIAEMAMTFIDRYSLDPRDVVVGAFGSGADVGKEMAIASQGRYGIYTVMEGNTPEREEEYNGQFFQRRMDELQNPEGKRRKSKVKSETQTWSDLYLNIRALMAFRFAKWLIAGGQIVDSSENSDFAEEVTSNKYKRSLQGNKIQLMSKKEMLKLRIMSPNMFDAGGLSMLRDLDDNDIQTKEEIEEIEREDDDGYDKFSSV